MSAAPPPLAIVVAVAENGVIGHRNRLPWHLRTDLRRFRALTMGKPLIMGRRCWDSIGRPLPGRETVVMTRDPGFRAEGAVVACSWEEAKAAAARAADRLGAGEIAVVGGADIYRLALPEAARIHLTLVHARPEGDVFFPDFDRSAFWEVGRVACPAGEGDEHAATFLCLERADLRCTTSDLAPSAKP